MFNRPVSTYDLDFNQLDLEAFFSDEANPLGRIVRNIPDGSRVLDIGCGNGLLGWIISRKHQRTVIDGIEPSAEASRMAVPFYRKIVNSMFHDAASQLDGSSYDYMILADVIEHVPDPLSFLQEIRKFMGNSTKLLLSIPNVAHGSVRLHLLNGYFRYSDSGLLERTHLRFLTQETIEAVFAKLGLSIAKLYHLQRPFLNEESRGYPITLRTKDYLRIADDPCAMTYQFMVEAQLEPIQRETMRYGATSPGYWQILDWKYSRVFPFSLAFRVLRKLKRLGS